MDLFTNSYWNIRKKCMEDVVDYYIYDLKYGDVYGDKNTDAILLIGKSVEYKGATFADKVILIIKDSRTGMFSGVPLEYGLGNRPRLFLGDFNNDGICEILIRIDAENAVTSGAFYIFSYKCSILRLIFDYKKFNNENSFQVVYLDRYKIEISCNNNQNFKIDISNKRSDYLFYIYNNDGKLIKPSLGKVLNINRLYPIITDDDSSYYSLLAIQNILGTDGNEILGYVQTLLQWNGTKFAFQNIYIVVDGITY